MPPPNEEMCPIGELPGWLLAIEVGVMDWEIGMMLDRLGWYMECAAYGLWDIGKFGDEPCAG